VPNFEEAFLGVTASNEKPYGVWQRFGAKWAIW